MQTMRQLFHSRDDLPVSAPLIDVGLGGLCFGLARSLAARTVLCIGSANGFAPGVFGLALQHNGSGLVHFVDGTCDYAIDGLKSYAGRSDWRVAGDRPFRDMGLDNVLVTVSTTFDYEWSGGLIDILFLDGDLSFAGVKHDFEKFAPFANFVLLCDSGQNASQPLTEHESEFPDVRQFAATLTQPHVEIAAAASVVFVDNRRHRRNDL